VFITSSGASYRQGSVLTCSSDGHPQPSYEWTDATGGSLVATGRNVTLADGEFHLTCTATGQFGESCSVSLSVDNMPANSRTTFSNHQSYSLSVQRAGLRRRRNCVQIAAATPSGNSLRQTVHTHRASVHQAAKLVAAVFRVARVTTALAESNGSLPPGL